MSLLLPKTKDTTAREREEVVREVLAGLWGTHTLLQQMSAYVGWNEKRIQKKIWDYAEQKGKSIILWPLRVALSGEERSPGPFTIAQAVGKRQTIRRIQKACTLLEGILK